MNWSECIHTFGIHDQCSFNHKIGDEMSEKTPFIGGFVSWLLLEINSAFREFDTQSTLIKFLIKTRSHFLMHGDGCSNHLSGQFLMG